MALCGVKEMNSGLAPGISKACGSLEGTQLFTSVAANSGHDGSKDRNRVFDGKDLALNLLIAIYIVCLQILQHSCKTSINLVLIDKP